MTTLGAHLIKAARRGRASIARLECTACGATIDAGCNCGAAYTPAIIRAERAVQQTPEKSDRAIAAEIGVDHKTVARARGAGGDNSPPERTGRDGKTYPTRRQPKKRTRDLRAQINNFASEPVEFAQRFVGRLGKWLDRGPALTDDAKSALITALNHCASEYERVAKHIMDYQGGKQ